MTDNYSPAVQKLANHFVDGQQFTTSSEVLLFSLDLLEAFNAHYASYVDDQIATAFKQRSEGKKRSFATSNQLNAFFADVMREGRTKLAQHASE